MQIEGSDDSRLFDFETPDLAASGTSSEFPGTPYDFGGYLFNFGILDTDAFSGPEPNADGSPTQATRLLMGGSFQEPNLFGFDLESVYIVGVGEDVAAGPDAAAGPNLSLIPAAWQAYPALHSSPDGHGMHMVGPGRSFMAAFDVATGSRLPVICRVCEVLFGSFGSNAGRPGSSEHQRQSQRNEFSRRSHSCRK